MIPASEVVSQQKGLRGQNPRLEDHSIVDVIRRGDSILKMRDRVNHDARNKPRRVVGSQGFDLGSDLPHVGGLDHKVRRDLALDREVPGLDVWRSQREVSKHTADRQRIQGAIEARRCGNLHAPELSRRGGGWRRQPEGSERVLDAAVENGRVSRKGGILLSKRVRVNGLIEDAVGAPHARPAVPGNVPRKP